MKGILLQLFSLEHKSVSKGKNQMRRNSPHEMQSYFAKPHHLSPAGDMWCSVGCDTPQLFPEELKSVHPMSPADYHMTTSYTTIEIRVWSEDGWDLLRGTERELLQQTVKMKERTNARVAY